MQRRFFALSLLAGGGLLTAGCGGGGGETASPLPVPDPVPPPDPDPATGTFAYVARPTLGDVSVNQVLASGALREVGRAPAGAGTRSVAVHPSGRFAYALNSNAVTISIYDRDTTTGLLHLKHPVALTSPWFPWDVRIHPSGELAYIGHGSGISTYAVDAQTGDVQFQSDTSTSFQDFDVHPSGQFVFVASDVGRLTSYRLDGDVLTEVNFVPTGTPGGVPSEVAVAPSGGFLYVTFQTGGIAIHRVEQGSGEVGPATLIDMGHGAIAIHPTGLFAYAAGDDESEQGGIIVFDVHPETGALTQSGFQSAGTFGLDSFAIDPSGLYVYAANHDANSVSAFSIHEATGALASVGAPIDVGGQAANICFFDSDQ